MKIKKTVYAGRFVKEAVYTAAVGNLAPETRAGKLRITSEAMSKVNFKYCYEKLAIMLACNFDKGDDVVTLTYNNKSLPANIKRVDADLKAFRAKASQCWKRKGKDFKMIWSIENKHEHGRWHVHCVINKCTGNDAALITALWGKGETQTKKMETGSYRNHLSLARYMAKEYETRENSKHAFHCTRNCSKPETVTERVPDSEYVHVPKGAHIIEEQKPYKTEFGDYSYAFYYIPDDAPARTLRLLKSRKLL